MTANAKENVIPKQAVPRGEGPPGRNRAPAIPTRFESELFDRLITAVAADYSGTHYVVSFTGRIDADRLMRAVRLTLDAEPILACRWVEHWFRPSWRRRDNLDRTELCEVRESSNFRGDVEDFRALPPDLPLRVLLLRGDTDLLCIKLDHRAGDGGAMRDYVYLLVDIYNRLCDDPSYEPAPNVDGRRGMQQLRDRFRFGEKLRIFWLGLTAIRRLARTAGTWTFPRAQNDALEGAYLRLDAARVRVIRGYALRQRATMSQVLVAALYRAISHARPQSSNRPLPISIAADLRRYLPSKKAAGLCNLNGIVVISIDPQSGESLDGVMRQVRDQMMQAQRSKCLGLPLSCFVVEGLPIIRHVVGLIPYWYMKRLVRRVRIPRILEREITRRVMFTDLGELELGRLAFAGTGIADAFITGGVFKEMTRTRGIAAGAPLAMAASEFQGSLILSLGYGPRALITELFEEMMRILPA